MTDKILTQEKLKTLLSYDPDTGILTWRKKFCRSIKVGSQVGTPTSEGYVAFHIRNKKWQVQMRFKGKAYYVGQFINLEEAIQARFQTETKLYADHNLYAIR